MRGTVDRREHARGRGRDDERWDAVELLRRLHALRIARTYMVQDGPERWVVYARPTQTGAELVFDLMASIERWLVDRELDAAHVRLDGRDEVIARPH